MFVYLEVHCTSYICMALMFPLTYSYTAFKHSVRIFMKSVPTVVYIVH